MEELKLVKLLLISLLLQMVLLVPKLLSWSLGVFESVFRVLKNTINTFVESLKKEVIKQ